MSLEQMPPKNQLAPQEKKSLIPVEDYGLKVHNLAVKDTLESAKNKQLAFWLLLSVTVVIIENAFKDSKVISWDTLWSILIVYVGTILLSFIINLLRAPRKLDKERQAKIEGLKGAIKKSDTEHKDEIDRLGKEHKRELQNAISTNTTEL